jgi:hypothetical protein
MRECTREHEIVEAVTSNCWPCDAELRNHANQCDVCRDLVLVVSALHDERESATLNVRVPSAGLVWWRSELRARREAARIAERPMTLAHSLAAASAVGVAAALIVGLFPGVMDLFGAVKALPNLGLLVGGLATLLVVAPLVVYYVFSDK